MRRVYSDKQLSFLHKGYLKWKIPELVRRFNLRFGEQKSACQIRATLKNHGFRCYRTCGNPTGSYRLFSKKQAGYIKKYYRKFSLAELVERFNQVFSTRMTEKQIRNFTRNHWIRSGRTGCFEKGSAPWNAGTKGLGLTGRNKTSFKPGDKPANRKPLGYERIDSKDGYVMVKIKELNPYTGWPTRFKPKHIVIWERDHGPVPKGMAIIFRDGNKLNFRKKNLACVSRAELLQMNRLGYSSYPTEIKPSVLALAKLETKVFHLKKERMHGN